jgi:hypothetical protein
VKDLVARRRSPARRTAPPEPAPEPVSEAAAPVENRLDRLVQKAEALAEEGFPFDWDEAVERIERAMRAGDVEDAESMLASAERLADRADRDWPLVLELFDRIDELLAIAHECGIDVERWKADVPDPRGLLASGRVTEGLLDQTAARASLALATLHDRLPRVLVAEAKTLGRALQLARDRGENVDSASRRLRAFLRGLRGGDVAEIGRAFLALRESIRGLSPATEGAGPDPEEEAEILLEARSLARRLRRIQEDDRYAERAARVAAQVQAALREGRSYATPIAEVDLLWSEVERLARERREAEDAQELPADLELPAAELEAAIEQRATAAPPEFLRASREPIPGALRGEEPSESDSEPPPQE